MLTRIRAYRDVSLGHDAYLMSRVRPSFGSDHPVAAACMLASITILPSKLKAALVKAAADDKRTITNKLCRGPIQAHAHACGTPRGRADRCG
jgi:hypothetical protein